MSGKVQVRRGNRLVTAVTVLRRPRIRARLKRAIRKRVRRNVTLPVKRRIRREIRRRPLFTCGACGKPYNSPLGHVCGNAGDFGKRRRARSAPRPRQRGRRSGRLSGSG